LSSIERVREKFITLRSVGEVGEAQTIKKWRRIIVDFGYRPKKKPSVNTRKKNREKIRL